MHVQPRLVAQGERRRGRLEVAGPRLQPRAHAGHRRVLVRRGRPVAVGDGVGVEHPQALVGAPGGTRHPRLEVVEHELDVPCPTMADGVARARRGARALSGRRS